MLSLQKNVLVFCGPTASGKTSLALSIAKLLPRVNLLSVDSRQIYKGLDIVTGKDIPKSLPTSIQIFGLDIVDPDKMFSLSDFVEYSKKVISDSQKEKVPLIIVGGTGLYLKAITSNLLDVHVPPDLDLRSKLEKKDVLELKKLLQEVNPEKYRSLNNSDVNNARRLIRAIEISNSSHQDNRTLNLSSTRMRGSISSNEPIFIWIGLKSDKKSQEKNIRKRVLDRIDLGAIQEVEALFKKYKNRSNPIFTSLGVKQIKEYLDNKITKSEMIESWTKAELDYARRQIVWFKKQKNIIWYDKSNLDTVFIQTLANKIQQNA